MQSSARQSDSTRRRGGFTMIELLVVLALILLLFGLSFGVLSASMDNARQEATRTTIRILDSALQERIEDFGRVNLRSQAKQFMLAYNLGSNPSPNARITEELALVLVKKDRFRGAFPQRLEDLYGFDGAAGGGDDSPLLRVWNNKLTTPANHKRETESIELLLLALTDGAVFGNPPMTIDSLNPNHLKDTDNDGLMEVVDEWGQPLRFYNWSTQLVRPRGGTVDPAAYANGDIGRGFFLQTAAVLIPDVPIISTGTDPVLATQFSHPLNQDPDDPVGFLGAQQQATSLARTTYFRSGFSNGVAVDEQFYHTIDTYWIPLIVSGGPDQKTGLFEPDGRDPRTPTVAATVADYPRRLARPLAEDLDMDGAIDSGEDLNGDGSLESPDALFDDITNRQP